jgi:hypothetical protein
MMPISVIVASFRLMILHAMTATSLVAKGGDDMQGQRHLRTHAGELRCAVLHQEEATNRGQRAMPPP